MGSVYQHIGPFPEIRDNFPERARFLLDAYRVKWCCIMLNNLLPSRARRKFAGLEDRTAHQLAKARSALQMVS